MRPGQDIPRPEPSPIPERRIADAVRQLLTAVGVDFSTPDFAQTAERVAALWSREFLSGYVMDPARILGDPVLGEPQTDAVFVFGLAYHAMCPHHLLPYQGLAHLVYVPAGKLVGFGRLGELVACFTHRLTLQERATRQIVDALMEHLGAQGAGCVLEAHQMCLGVPNDQHAANKVVTTAFAGELLTRSDLRQRLLADRRDLQIVEREVGCPIIETEVGVMRPFEGS